MNRRRFLLVARIATSLGLLGVVAYLLDPREIASRLRTLDPAWVVGAIAVSVGQVVGSAWRWRFTAGRLGMELPMPRAISEYYLSTFLNQVLPGGVLGDVSRAWRHARDEETRASIQAVAFERLSGVFVMSAVAVVSATLLLAEVSGGWRVALMLPVVGLGAWGIVTPRRLRQRPGAARLAVDFRRALLDGIALPVQLVTSSAVVASYLIVFVMAARAVGLDSSTALTATLAGPVLMTMLIPATIAGWGLREAAAAALWSAVGLSAADGVVVSVAYGLLVLLSSLPGAIVLMITLARSGALHRREDQSPTESAGPEGDAPDRASRSPTS